MSSTALEGPAPVSNFTEEEVNATLASVRSMYALLHIEFVVLAIQLGWCMCGLSRYMAIKSSIHTRRRRPYLITSFVILGLFSVASVTDSIFFSTFTFNISSYTSENPWYSSLGSACNTLVILVGDGVLIYRCYFIWPNRRWVLVIPSIALFASTVLAILLFSRRTSPTSHIILSGYIALSVVSNSVSTALIAGKLLWERKKLSKALQNAHLVKYTTAAAILMESALPLALVGIISSAIIIHRPDWPAVYVFPGIWFCFSGLFPQLIIFRVAIGTSYPADLQATQEMSQAIYFARPRSDTGESMSA